MSWFIRALVCVAVSGVERTISANAGSTLALPEQFTKPKMIKGYEDNTFTHTHNVPRWEFVMRTCGWVAIEEDCGDGMRMTDESPLFPLPLPLVGEEPGRMECETGEGGGGCNAGILTIFGLCIISASTTGSCGADSL